MAVKAIWTAETGKCDRSAKSASIPTIFKKIKILNSYKSRRTSSFFFSLFVFLVTCNTKHDASKRCPTISTSSFEIPVNINRRESFQDACVMFPDVVHTDTCNGEKPEKDNGSEEPTNTVCSVMLYTKQAD